MRSLLLLCLLAPFAGCGEDNQVAPATASRDVWIGTYSVGPGLEHGVIAMDVTSTGADVAGRLVLRSRSSTAPYDQLYLRGTVRDDSLRLEPDPTRHPGLQGFGIQAVRKGGRLSGTLTYAAYSIVGSLDCEAFTVNAIAVPKSFAVRGTTIIGLASVGTDLWASNADFGYDVYDTTGVRRLGISVRYYPDADWVSDALTSDGTRLWGQYPVSIGGSTPHNESVLVEFTPQGVITARHDVRHRISGLAYDGSALWSLPQGGDVFDRLDTASGAVLDSVDVSVPDVTKFTSDGTRFWAVGWFLNLLYEIDRQGQVVRIYDQPSESRGDRPTGLTFVGGSLWLARTNASDSWLYRTRVEP